MSMRVFERRAMQRRFDERRRYDRRMTTPDPAFQPERRQAADRRGIVVERRDEDERRGD
jgi:hypothetical protein